MAGGFVAGGQSRRTCNDDHDASLVSGAHGSIAVAERTGRVAGALFECAQFRQYGFGGDKGRDQRAWTSLMSALDWLIDIFTTRSHQRVKEKTAHLKEEVRRQSHKFNNQAMGMNKSLEDLVRFVKQKQHQQSESD
jgi:hypothetical protein